MATAPSDGKTYVVVAGVDFSEASELAVQRAFELAAERPHAEVHLLNVVQTYGPQVAYEMPMDASALSVLTVAEARARFKSYADQAIARFSAQKPGIQFRVFTHVRFDSVADEIAQLAADLDADLVVVGTHGRRGLSRMLLGSSAEATVRLAPCQSPASISSRARMRLRSRSLARGASARARSNDACASLTSLRSNIE